MPNSQKETARYSIPILLGTVLIFTLADLAAARDLCDEAVRARPGEVLRATADEGVVWRIETAAPGALTLAVASQEAALSDELELFATPCGSSLRGEPFVLESSAVHRVTAAVRPTAWGIRIGARSEEAAGIPYEIVTRFAAAAVRSDTFALGSLRGEISSLRIALRTKKEDHEVDPDPMPILAPWPVDGSNDFLHLITLLEPRPKGGVVARLAILPGGDSRNKEDHEVDPDPTPIPTPGPRLSTALVELEGKSERHLIRFFQAAEASGGAFEARALTGWLIAVTTNDVARPEGRFRLLTQVRIAAPPRVLLERS